MKVPKKFTKSKHSQRFREKHPMHLAYKLINLDLENYKDLSKSVIIDVRVFWPVNCSVCKAIVWITDIIGNRYGWRIGIADGYGYHHESAAIYDALCDMGIEFEREEAFDGIGSRAQENAIINLGKAMGYENTFLVDFNP